MVGLSRIKTFLNRNGLWKCRLPKSQLPYYVDSRFLRFRHDRCLYPELGFEKKPTKSTTKRAIS